MAEAVRRPGGPGAGTRRVGPRVCRKERRWRRVGGESPGCHGSSPRTTEAGRVHGPSAESVASELKIGTTLR
ncbi:hypothetical protein NDU88_003914 [Pleurodeles waltl]|uniref:Uncharacterized protein n=1 Tax=Pleurodeles waltl TaxID=8319 RepID=A0AAV7WU59_PLEWA|nr:hypothetical protein NDU88_003914 [Pleurodeles waltl]